MSASLKVPVLGSGRLVLFPGMRCAVHVRSARSSAALAAARRRPEGSVAVFASRFEADLEHGVAHLHEIGTLARVVELGKRSCCDSLVAELEGTTRVRLALWSRTDAFREAECLVIGATGDATTDERRLAFEVSAMAQRIHVLFPRCHHVRDTAERVAAAVSPEEVAGAVGSLLLHLPTSRRQRLLELEPLGARLEEVLLELHARIARATPRDAIN